MKRYIAALSICALLASTPALAGKDRASLRNTSAQKSVAAKSAGKGGDVALLEIVRFPFRRGEERSEIRRRLSRAGRSLCQRRVLRSASGACLDRRLAHRLPTAAGRLMQMELEHLARALENPQRPVVAIVGGAKVSTKIDLLTNLVAKVNALVIGGGMANTFLHARGMDIGQSLAERDLADTAREVEQRAKAEGCRILLPEDAVIAAELKPDIATRIVSVSAVPQDAKILDIGPNTAAAIEELLGEARSLVNEPLGAFETPPFDEGTLRVARKAAELTEAGRLLSVAGGGDTVAALAAAGVEEQFSYVSTAGGAFLEWLEGKELPGVAALSIDNKPR